MRITLKDLEAVCARINRTVNGKEMSPYGVSRHDGDTRPEWRWNIDAYTLDGAYGGYSLHRVVGESGGVTDVFGCGHIPKRDLYERMQAFLRGIEAPAASGSKETP